MKPSPKEKREDILPSNPIRIVVIAIIMALQGAPFALAAGQGPGLPATCPPAPAGPVYPAPEVPPPGTPNPGNDPRTWCRGEVRPPNNIDPAIVQPPPETGNTPVIPPAPVPQAR